MAENRPWMDTSKEPAERARLLVDAMTLEQKIQQLHGSMKTVDIYSAFANADPDADLEQLAAQIQVERHVKGIDELGIPRFRITNGPVGVG
ncbi:MAG: glycosyl hydrolase, partial [Actinomycetaceae bacterium]|nr:glycosyl hydrolase [Actinomycetaceae bacterium]